MAYRITGADEQWCLRDDTNMSSRRPYRTATHVKAPALAGLGSGPDYRNSPLVSTRASLPMAIDIRSRYLPFARLKSGQSRGACAKLPEVERSRNERRLHTPFSYSREPL